MPEVAEHPTKHGRNLTGFYIGLGVVVALVGLGAWMWKPLYICHLEREVKHAISSAKFRSASGYDTPEAARKLARCGPSAYAAFDRLLKWQRFDDGEIVSAFWDRDLKGQTWALPLLAREAKSTAFRVYHPATCAAETITGIQFIEPVANVKSDEFGQAVDKGRERFLVWWEQEGRAKYGEPMP